MKNEAEKFFELIKKANGVLIVQADNPDADSLGSALALNEILNNENIPCSLYCGVDVPSYLKYMESWSLVENSLPNNFDTTIIVDASTNDLLEKVRGDVLFSKFDKSKKIILDHHKTTSNDIQSELSINSIEKSSTSELVYDLAFELGLEIPIKPKEYIVSGILGDTQGLSNNLASPATYRVVAKLIEDGVNREKLENKRREYNQYTEGIYRYKAELINNTQLLLENKLAVVVVRQAEINKYSPLYNPSALILPDMTQIENVTTCCVIKIYDDGKITGTIRTTSKYPIAAKIAESLGGGGHDFASGFKIISGEDESSIIKKLVTLTDQYISEANNE